MSSESDNISGTYCDIFKEKDLEEIKTYLTADNFDINSEDDEGDTPLVWAVEDNNFELVQFILDLPEVDINVQTGDSRSTALMLAAKKEDSAILKFLLERGADLRLTDDEGYTALMYASLSGSFACVEELIKHKDCNVNALNEEGWNALIVGIRYPEVVKRLIDLTDLSIEDNEGYNAFNFACNCDSGSIEVVQMLLEKYPFDINKMSKNGYNAIMLAANEKHFHIVDYLIEKGASLSQCNENGACGYHYIVAFDDSETYFDNREFPETFMLKAIEEAARTNRKKMLQKFMEKVLSTDSAFEENEISASFGLAIQAAANSGNLECVKMLLASNLISEEDLEISLDAAVQGNNSDSFECLKYIYEVMPKPLRIDMDDIFAEAMDSENFESCKMILQHYKVDPNRKEYLMIASYHSDFELVKLLVERGADINRIGNDKSTAILIAVANNNFDIVKYLLEKGADPILTNKLGLGPLITAAYEGNFEIFKAILAKDQNIHHKANDGSSVFLAACTSGNLDILKILIEMGANVKEVDFDNNNCFYMVAQKAENLDSFIYLLDHVENSENMLNVANIGGKTPLDFIVELEDFSYLSELLEAKPDLIKYFNFPDEFLIEKNDNNDICLICRDEFEVQDEAVKLPCEHFYHKHCFDDWFKVTSTCPHCKVFPYSVKISSEKSVPFEKFARILLNRDNLQELKQLLSSKNFDINRIDNEGGVAALHIATFSENIEAINFISKLPNANINVMAYETKLTPLSFAADEGKLQALKCLIAKGADLNLKNRDGFTALMLAVRNDHVECVEELLKHENCDVNAVNNKGFNAFMIGIENIELVRILIDKTDLIHETNEGLTALHYACYAGLLEVVQLILAKNVVDVNKPHRNGLTPVQLAFTSLNMDIIECLRQHGAKMSGTMTVAKVGGSREPEVVYHQEFSPVFNTGSQNIGGPQPYNNQYHPQPPVQSSYGAQSSSAQVGYGQSHYQPYQTSQPPYSTQSSYNTQYPFAYQQPSYPRNPPQPSYPAYKEESPDSGCCNIQ